MEAIYSSETWVEFWRIARRYITEKKLSVTAAVPYSEKYQFPVGDMIVFLLII
jgi:hypothetical protein